MITSLGSPPKNKPHLMADYLEICLAIGEFEVLAHADAASIIIESSMEDEELQPDGVSGLSTAEIHFDDQIKIEEWFEHLAYRKEAFGSLYPFEINENVLTKAGKWTNENYLYLFLLICSRLKIFDGSTRLKLASCFEKLSKEATKRLWPNAVVRLFSPGSDDRKKFYGGRLGDAIPQLAQDLNEPLDPANLKNLSELISGDGGLDVIAYFPFDDLARGFPVWLGQCASKGENWKDKKSQAQNITGIIRFTYPPGNLLFIPACFRSPSGEWFNNIDVMGCVLLDRLRICNLLKNNVPTRELQEPTFIKFLAHYDLN